MSMTSAKADQYKGIIAKMLGISEEKLTDAMLDCGRDFLKNFLGEDNEKAAHDFEALPEFWVWFRQMWAGDDLKFITEMDKRPKLLAKVKSEGIQENTYYMFHWHEMQGKRPVSSVLSLFLEGEKVDKQKVSTP